MDTIKTALAILILVAVGSIPGRAQVPMDLAVRRGIEMCTACQNHELEIRSLELAQKGARLRGLFTLDAGVSYLFRSEQMEIVFPPTQVAPGVVMPGNRILAGAKHNYDFKLVLAQPLFTGHILSNTVRLEEVRLAVEKNQALLGKIETAAGVKSSYFTYRMLQSQLDSLDVLIEQLQLHYRKLQAYFREELVKKSDLLETEAKIQEQVLNRQDWLQQIKEEQINFKTLCGFDIQEMERDYREEAGNFEEAFGSFQVHQPVLKSLAERLAALGLQEKMARGEYLPQVGGFAELHYGKPGIDFFANQWSLYFQGGISVALKIFDWNRLGREVQVIRYGKEKVKNERREFIREGEKHLRQLYAARSTAEAKLETVKKLVQIAVQDISLKEKLVQEQQIDNIDYLSALCYKERCVSWQHTMETQLELIKVNINRIIGKFEEER